jgi:hypothetical protein
MKNISEMKNHVARSNRSDSMEEKACDIDVYNNQNYPK